jgi:hypothetical protein
MLSAVNKPFILSVIMLNVLTLSVIMLSIVAPYYRRLIVTISIRIEYHCAECSIFYRYAECYSAECSIFYRYAECCFGVCSLANSYAMTLESHSV